MTSIFHKKQLGWGEQPLFLKSTSYFLCMVHLPVVHIPSNMFSSHFLSHFGFLLILYLQRMFYLKLRRAEPSQSVCSGSTNGSRPYALRCKNNTPPPHPLFRLLQGAAGSRRLSSPVRAVSPARLCAEGALLNVRSLSFSAWQGRITMSFLTRNSLSIREVSRNTFF